MELPVLPNPTYPFFHGYKTTLLGASKIEACQQMRSVYKLSPGSQPPTNKPGLGKLKPMVSQPSINIHYLSSCKHSHGISIYPHSYYSRYRQQ